MKKPTAIIYIIMLILSCSLALAIPFGAYKGYLTVDGSAAAANTPILVYVDGTLQSTYYTGDAETPANYFLIGVDGVANQQITFKPYGIAAIEGVQTLTAGIHDKNLSISTSSSEGACLYGYSWSDEGCSSSLVCCSDNSCKSNCTATTTPSTGGSGGGGSYSITETKTQPTILAGATGSFSFSKSGLFGVTQIDVTVNSSVSSSSVTVTETSKPSSAPIAIAAADGSVYKYLQITSTISNSLISQAIIKFKVSKSWVTANNIDPEKMYLQKLVNNEWEQMHTTKTDEDASYFYYEATVPSFSLYSIVGYKNGATVPVVEKTHMGCSSERCIVVQGEGADACNTDAECKSVVPVEPQPPVVQPPVVIQPPETKQPKNNIFLWTLGILAIIAIITFIVVITSPKYEIWNHERKIRVHEKTAIEHKEQALNFTEKGNFDKAMQHEHKADHEIELAKKHHHAAAKHHHKSAERLEKKMNFAKAEEHRAKAKEHERMIEI